jgi:hypothetical protein
MANHTKPLGMQYSTSYADPGLKMQEHLCFCYCNFFYSTLSRVFNKSLKGFYVVITRAPLGLQKRHRCQKMCLKLKFCLEM